MASFLQPATQSNRASPEPDSLELDSPELHSPELHSPELKVSLFDLFQQYVPILSGLPGGTSQFDQTEIGFEWHCEFEIGAGSTEQARLQIHFHLIDLEQLPKPAAVLYLVEAAENSQKQNRLPLPLANLTATHEKLNEQLAEKKASIEAFENAGNFILALANVRESLQGEVAWV
jgi:hypothetical protein